MKSTAHFLNNAKGKQGKARNFSPIILLVQELNICSTRPVLYSLSSFSNEPSRLCFYLAGLDYVWKAADASK